MKTNKKLISVKTRINNLPTIDELNKKLKGKSPDEVVKLLGKPDETCLSPSFVQFSYREPRIYDIYTGRGKNIRILFRKNKFSSIRA